MAQYLQSRIENPIWLEPNEISFLQTRISEEEAFVQTLESRMDALRAQISELTCQKDAKLVEIASLRNILAPVRRVPLEILTEIFELSCLPKYSLYDSDLVPDMFMLTSVCAAWRKAAHITPQLWSTLCISLEKLVLGPEFTWVEDWIIRSQVLPLNLYLNFYTDRYDESLIQRGKRFLEHILTQFSHKVRSLNVIGHPSSFLPILHLSPSSSLLSLEKISLMIYDKEGDIIEDLVALLPTKVTLFLGAPKLQQVELSDASLLEFLALPAEQLTSLKVDEENELDFDPVVPDPVVFVDILSRCKQLVNLEIYLPSDGFIGFSTSLLILLPTLRSLKVTCYSAVDNILRCITAPLLGQLHLCYRGTDLDSLVTDMTAFQQRSSTPLSSLKLHISCRAGYEVKIITQRIIGILSVFPMIHSLEIHPSFNPDLLMQAMTCTEGHHALPNLKELVLDGLPDYYLTKKKYSLSGSGFKAMVLSRWWPDDDGSASFCNGLCRLQKVTLRGFHVSDSARDITHVSTLYGLVLEYRPVEEWW